MAGTTPASGSPAFDKRYDVLVCGAGVAGVAAAMEAARRGVRVALVEKTVTLGGLATAGLINIYLPLCDGRGKQVLFGLAEELMYLCFRYGPGGVPECWRKGPEAEKSSRLTTRFSPAAFALALDEALEHAGVEVWLDTAITGALVESGAVRGVEVANKSGRGHIEAACTVDATGDADVAFLAGAECIEGDNWLSIWAEQRSLDACRRAVETGRVPLDTVGCGADDAGRGHPQGAPIFRGVSGRAVTDFVLAGRRLLRERYRARQSEDGASRETVFPATLPSMAQLRMTRRIAGRATAGGLDFGKRVEDSVGLVPDWRTEGRVWEVPFGALVPRGVAGLVAAGRCISAEGDAWQTTRVIPAAAFTGQVAGLAVAESVLSKVAPADLEAGRLQSELRSHGFPLHLDEEGAP